MITHHLSIAALLSGYRSGETNPVAVTDNFLARIATHRHLHAFTALDPTAPSAASVSTARWAGGSPRPLEGVPLAVKANIAVAGLVTHAGTAALLSGPAAATNAPAVAVLREAGAIILGHLNMHEAALGATTDNPAFGRALNPWGQNLSPGGSSGGSGAAVAAGLCTAALGTDTLGSVRIPASYCGVYGLKPTNGLIADEGVVALAAKWDTIGPFARTPKDVRILLNVLANIAETPPITTVAILAATSLVEQTPAVAAAYARAQSALCDLGLQVDLVPYDLNLGHIRLAGFIEAALELADQLGPRLAHASPGLNESIAYARSVAPGIRAKGQVLLAASTARTREILRDYGAILTPTTPHPAHPHTGAMVTTSAHFTAFVNLAGAPAIACPAGLDESGLPVSAQLVGRPHHDTALIDLAERLAPALGRFEPPPAFA